MNIRDNGQWKQKEHTSGTGTHSMKQRAEGLGGTLTISGNEDGTNVALAIPIP
jgi:signal transduction histidine kinase